MRRLNKVVVPTRTAPVRCCKKVVNAVSRSSRPLGIDLMLHQQGLDTTTPAGKAMFQMMGVFAEFERAMIRERVKAGLELRPSSTWPATTFAATPKLHGDPGRPDGTSSCRYRCR
jgi:hypothetical protein